MTSLNILAFAAALSAVVIGVAAVFRKWVSAPSWCFLVGMLLLGVESALEMRASLSGPAEIADRMVVVFWVKSLLPGVWLTFSILYCRRNGADAIRRWRWVLVAAFVVPPSLALFYQGQLVDLGPNGIEFLPVADALMVSLLLVTIAILFNLERTYRSSVGLTRWRIKFLLLGAAVIFGVKAYALSQMLLSSGYGPSIPAVSSAGLLVGCGLMTVGYLRQGFGDFDIHPSRSVLQGSITILVAGGFLAVVGFLAHSAGKYGRGSDYPIQAFIVIAGVTALALVLLSDRARIGIQQFVSRHFIRPEHDFRSVWADFTRRTSGLADPESICATTGHLIAGTFSVLRVSVFLREDDSGDLRWASTTSEEGARDMSVDGIGLDDEAVARILKIGQATNLESLKDPWALELKAACPRQFGHGGNRTLVPVVSGEQFIGLILLTDRVNGVPYNLEELELLDCIADQLGVALVNRTLNEEVMRARELEAFRTMSSFFVHDLKNAANRLNLMLQNLPQHFHDPHFREDALRSVGKTVDRINGLVVKLGALRQDLELSPESTDLNALIRGVTETLAEQLPFDEVVENLGNLPPVSVDPEQMRSVITNLLVNAGEAVNGDGRLTLSTICIRDRVTLTVSDNGCGMDDEFVRTKLFRPFSSTKSSGLGIGMFQCKRIVEAHEGTIRAETQSGEGTTFRITLPASTPIPLS
ncbi:XrtA/PEP-CTERM system histidine kinase PrsK [Haloferula sp.]|uniref:XrtA/PEP-CTERM system histidine kinase PrsK n=1 Tax=Haloferula sp. TaxID=2497595 RepID=UPI0032A0E24E